MTFEKPLRYSLFDNGMGTLERAGLAGLYLTLQGADEWAANEDTNTGEQARNLKDSFQPWDLTHASELTLDWNGDDPLKPFTALVKWAWQVREGVFFFPGIHRTLAERNNRYRRVPTHNGILSTFLQHNKTRPKVAAPKDEEGDLVVPLDDNTTIEIPRFPIVQDSDNGKPNDPQQYKVIGNILSGKETLSSAYYPGIAPRFQPDKGWTGSSSQAVLLLFAPLACLFLELPRNRITLKQGKQQSSPNYAAVIPDIVDLPGYASAWPQLHRQLQERFDKIRCKSTEDAALRVAFEYATISTRKVVTRLGATPTLYVFCMGRTPYQRKDTTLSKIQMIRKQIVDIRPQPVALRRYQKLMAYMDNRTVPVARIDAAQKNGASHHVRTLSGRGRIAEKLVEGRAWYTDLFVPTDWERDTLEWERERYNERREDKISSQQLWREHLQRQPEKEALMALTKDSSMYDNPETEMILTQVIHDMMATLFRKEREAIKSRSTLKEDSPEFEERRKKREDDLVDDLYRSFSQAQTRDLFRQALMGWLTKGGTHKTIREHRKEIWDFVNHPYNWKKARDLALLSLITYESRSPKKKEAKP